MTKKKKSFHISQSSTWIDHDVILPLLVNGNPNKFWVSIECRSRILFGFSAINVRGNITQRLRRLLFSAHLRKEQLQRCRYVISHLALGDVTIRRRIFGLAFVHLQLAQWRKLPKAAVRLLIHRTKNSPQILESFREALLHVGYGIRWALRYDRTAHALYRRRRSSRMRMRANCGTNCACAL